jgi:uncharacterized Rossmann fold enzyme
MLITEQDSKKNNDIYICIGGGELTEEEKQHIASIEHQYPIIGINRSSAYFNCDYNVVLDYFFLDDIEKSIIENNKKTPIFVCYDFPKHWGKRKNKIKIIKNTEPKLERNTIDLCSFPDGGTTALSLAYSLGAKEIILAGYTTDREYEHFYSENKEIIPSSIVQDKINIIDAIASQNKDVKLYEYRQNSLYNIQYKSILDL